MTADGDSQDEAVSGSLGLALFAEADDRRPPALTALEATTVSNRNREKLHMAMTADGNSRFRERDGSLGLLVRVDNEEEIDGLVSGGLDWSGTTHPSRDDIRVRMAVSNKDRERFRMAMTADGDSQDEAVSGSLGLALFAEADEKFDGRVSGGLDWSDALEATMTVSNRNREKLHMAMTADGNSRFRERDGSSGCSCASITRRRSTALCPAASTGAARRTRAETTYGSAWRSATRTENGSAWR